MDTLGPEADAPGRLLSRRKVLVGGTAAAAVLWVAPTIESFAPAAAAASLPPSCGSDGLSYLSLLVCLDKSFYRCKFDLSECDTVPGSSIPGIDWNTCGYEFTNQPCYGQQETDPTCFPGSQLISSEGPQLSGEYCVDEQGSTSFRVTNHCSTQYSIGAYVVNKDVTCAWGKESQLTCTPYYQGPSGSYVDSNGWLSIESGGCVTFPGIRI